MIKSANISPAKNLKDWFKPGTPDDAIDLVVKMLQFNPKTRITIDEVLKHPYISQFRDQKT
jgi:serine/threonine protein kinase